MEDNLSKARTSFLPSPSLSPNVGDHKPVGGLYRSISQGGDRRIIQGGSSRKSKALYPAVHTPKSGHTRGSSETSLLSASAVHSRIPEIRSASALEYTSGQSIDSLPYDGSPSAYSNGQSPASATPRSFHTPLQSLQEETGKSPSTDRTSPSNQTPRGLGITTSSDLDHGFPDSRHGSNGSGEGACRI